MRVYMVKSESEFTRLALQKYMEEIVTETKKQGQPEKPKKTKKNNVAVV